VTREAHEKYKRELARDPLVIAATTDGFVTSEGLKALAVLTEVIHAGVPTPGPRLMLTAGFALCEAAARAYEVWYTSVRSASGVG
jgi:hypothetical protein